MSQTSVVDNLSSEESEKLAVPQIITKLVRKKGNFSLI